MEKVSEKPLVLIDYAHTQKAFETVLKTLKTSNNTRQSIILVFGCGGDRDKNKRPEMAKIAEKHAMFIIVTEDNSRTEATGEIFKDIISGFTDNARHKVIKDRKKAIEYAIGIANENDVILIIGKGHEKYIIDKNEYRYFDEKNIIKDAIIKHFGAK